MILPNEEYYFEAKANEEKAKANEEKAKAEIIFLKERIAQLEKIVKDQAQ